VAQSLTLGPSVSHSSGHVTNVHPMQSRSKSGISKPKNILSLTMHMSESEPTSFKEVFSHPKWKVAMTDEFNALISNDTWELVPPHYAYNLVVSKWLFQMKYNFDGSLERYKARLIAAENHQRAGVNFHDTFAPVVCPATFHLIVSLTITHHWPIRRLDVKNAFLHGILTEKVYMCQPPGFIDLNFPHHM